MERVTWTRVEKRGRGPDPTVGRLTDNRHYLLFFDFKGNTKVVKTDADFFEQFVLSRQVKILMSEGDKYPWAQPLLPTLPAATYLHIFIWTYFHPTRPPPQEWEVHHRNENKLDARKDNLLLVTERGHKSHTYHQAKRKKPTGQPNGGKYYRDHCSAPVTFTDGPVALAAHQPPQPSPPSPVLEALQGVTKKLVAQYPALYASVRHLEDRAEKIPGMAPRAKWRKKGGASLGLAQQERMGCRTDEAAFVAGLIAHKFEREPVMAALGLSAWVYDHYRAQVPVQVALERWHKYRRLPKPRSPNSIHRRSKKVSVRRTPSFRRSAERVTSPVWAS